MSSPTGLGHILARHIGPDAFAGAAVGVGRGGQLLVEHYAGDAAPGLASSPTVVWPIASISKVFTAAMVMRLVELGELTVNTLVSDVLPRLSGQGRETIRLRHLLTHTSGLPYESDEMETRLIAETPLDAMIEEACATPLLFEPGTRFHYGDYAYLLAGHMAAVVTGTSYADLVRDLVIAPMGLHDSHVTQGPELHDRMSYVRGGFAEGTDGAMYNSAYSRSLGHPAFGVAASLRDMVRFGSHFAPGGPRIHAEATVRAMTRSQTGGVPGHHPANQGWPDGACIPWGYGFELQTEQVPAVFSELASFETFGHGGATGCHLVIDPVADLVVVVVANTHINTGRDRWLARQQSILNAAFAEFASG
jgi:CubicO group peptidase (beta-lactamase class C family)